jgi:hypothetical protein
LVHAKIKIECLSTQNKTGITPEIDVHAPQKITKNTIEQIENEKM